MKTVCLERTETARAIKSIFTVEQILKLQHKDHS